MKGDNSRETFSKEKHYSAVRQQQGRVQVDADWNEQVAIQRHLDTTEGTDVIGQCGAPEETPGFEVAFNDDVDGNGGDDFTMSAGRLYVDGILVELEESASYCNQPYFPDPPCANHSSPRAIDWGSAPTPGDQGFYVIYIDVWERHVTWVEAPSIREVALAGPDTATRTQVVWQVQIAGMPAPGEGLLPRRNSRMKAYVEDSPSADNPCSLAPSAGYRGLENQLYRVEVHDSGVSGDATLKWSRDNGSTLARWLDPPAGSAHTLRVEVAGGDAGQRFATGDWVELSGDRLELGGYPGVFVRLLRVGGDLLEYDPTSVIYPRDLPSDLQTLDRSEYGDHAKVRRWDCAGPLKFVESTPIPLENGINAEFWIPSETSAEYQTGDYWLVPARAATHGIEWPESGTGPSARARAVYQPPLGIDHHIGILAKFKYGAGQTVETVRPTFPPLTRIHCDCAMPLPNQYRCYMVDPDNGDDDTAVVGISDTSALDAVTKAASGKFQTIHAVQQCMPKFGNDSIAMILLGKRTGTSDDQLKGVYPSDDPLELTGLEGYKRVIVRSSDFSNDQSDKERCASIEICRFMMLSMPGYGPTGPLNRLDRNFVFRAALVPGSTYDDSLDWRGARIVFYSTDGTGNWDGQCLTLESVTPPSSSGGDYIIRTCEPILATLTGAYGSVPTCKVEMAGVRLNSIAISANTGKWVDCAPSGTAIGHSPIVIAGIRCGSTRLSGVTGIALSSVAITDLAIQEAQYPLMSLQVGPSYEDEDGATITTGLAGYAQVWPYQVRTVRFTRTVLDLQMAHNCGVLIADGCFVASTPSIHDSIIRILNGALSSTQLVRSGGLVDGVVCLADDTSFLITISEGTKGTLNLANFQMIRDFWAGSDGTLLRLDPDCRNAEVVVKEPGSLTDIQMADDAVYEPQLLAVSDIRDAFNNHIQGTGGCVISNSGMTVGSVCSASPSGVRSFTIVGLYDGDGTPYLGEVDGDASSFPSPVGVTQCRSSTVVIDPTSRTRLVTSGCTAIRLHGVTTAPVAPCIVYLGPAGTITVTDGSGLQIGTMLEVREGHDTTGAGLYTELFGIVALDVQWSGE
jgi:hypothetical protein